MINANDNSPMVARIRDYVARSWESAGGEVARVRLYRVPTERGLRYLMVHLTAAGVVTDYDFTLL